MDGKSVRKPKSQYDKLKNRGSLTYLLKILLYLEWTSELKHK